MDTKNVNVMYRYIAYCLFGWLITGLFISCKCKPDLKVYIEGFEIPNLVTILNPKDTFDLGDTLWIKAEFPNHFYEEYKNCDYKDTSLDIDLLLYVSFSDKTPELLTNLPLIAKIGTTQQNFNYTFIKNNNLYISEFGLILNDTSIFEISSDVFTNSIVLRNSNSEGCIYTDEYCKEPLVEGFNIYTTFQGGATSWKINMRQ